MSCFISYAAIIFVVCALFSLHKDRTGKSFYTAVVWALIFLGGVEAVWGLQQLYGFTASNHSLFALTGSFYNPGPYSGYLAMIVPICLSQWLHLRKKERCTWLERGKYYLSLAVLLLIVCVLPAGLSRSAWIAALVSGTWVYGMHHSWGSRLKKWAIRHRKNVIPIVVWGGVAAQRVSACGGMHHHYDACKKWSGAKMLYRINALQSAKENYEKLYPKLKDRGVFLCHKRDETRSTKTNKLNWKNYIR